MNGNGALCQLKPRSPVHDVLLRVVRVRLWRKRCVAIGRAVRRVVLDGGAPRAALPATGARSCSWPSERSALAWARLLRWAAERSAAAGYVLSYNVSGKTREGVGCPKVSG